MTLDRWYRHGAIVLWPAKWHYDNLCDCGAAAALSALHGMIQQWKQAEPAEKETLKAECIQLARGILTHWSGGYYSNSPDSEEGTPRTDPSPELTALNEPSLIQEYVKEVLPKSAAVGLSAPLLKVIAKHGWEHYLPALQTLFGSTNKAMLTRNARLLEQLCELLSKQGEEGTNYSQSLVQAMLSALEEVDRNKDDYQWYVSEKDRAVLVTTLVMALVIAGLSESLSRLIEYVLSVPKKYPLLPVQVEALAAFKPWLRARVAEPNEALSKWLLSCRQQLEALTAEMPTEPRDYRRQAHLHCKCADCAELATFLKDPAAPVHRFSVRQERRSHLENTIRNDQCDVRSVTERKWNSP